MLYAEMQHCEHSMPSQASRNHDWYQSKISIVLEQYISANLIRHFLPHPLEFRTARFLIGREEYSVCRITVVPKRRRRHAEGPTDVYHIFTMPSFCREKSLNCYKYAKCRCWWLAGLVLEEHLAGNLQKIMLVMLKARNHACSRTYGPCAGQTSHNTSRHHGGPDAARALEDRARNATSNHTVHRVVLAAVVSDSAVETVVHHRNHTGRVAKERSSPCDSVEDGVEAELRRC